MVSPSALQRLPPRAFRPHQVPTGQPQCRVYSRRKPSCIAGGALTSRCFPFREAGDAILPGVDHIPSAQWTIRFLGAHAGPVEHGPAWVLVASTELYFSWLPSSPPALLSRLLPNRGQAGSLHPRIVFASHARWQGRTGTRVAERRRQGSARSPQLFPAIFVSLTVPAGQAALFIKLGPDPQHAALYDHVVDI